MIRVLSILFMSSLLFSCSESVNTDLSNYGAEETFQLLLQESIDDSFGAMPGVSMSVNSSLLSQSWHGAAGYGDIEGNSALRHEQVFRIASVTKTFVAAAILRLHELDSISIEDPISFYIDKNSIDVLKTDGYNPEQILIKHCLNHTSGLEDYIFVTDDYINELISNPQKRWTREQQLEGAVNWGDKVGEPGEQTKYCDTGYILLGAIIESFFKGDMAQGLRTLLSYDRLGLTSTWLETLEPHPLDQSEKVHRYHGKYETTDWDASIDLFGGGGLVSNTADLANFLSALFDNKVFDKPQTIDLMLSIPDHVQSTSVNDLSKIAYYNYGLWTIQVFGNNVHMHTGFWGTTVLYIPAYKSSIAVNGTRGNNDRMIKKTLLVLEKLSSRQ